MLHFLLFACIKAGPAYDNTAHLPTAALSGVFSAQDTTKVYEEALARRHDGDYRGAIDRLTWLIENDAETPDRLYQLGITYELSGDYGTAISVYERLMQDEAHVLDGGFRRALCLESTGDWDAALKQYRKLPQAQGFDRHDRITLDLALGIAELSAGKEKKGRAMIEEALRASEGTDDVTWIQAKARYALADHALDSARELSLQGREKRVARSLEGRAFALAEAESHVIQVIQLEEPEWILESMLRPETASWSCARTCWPCPRPGTSIPSSGRSTSRRSRSGPRC
ncbi:MAG: tetratricopeptide repeat protein [Proteobacteria bacterium]|nr:tetratricopeptide repeat protein [Pseudomonadota bacterium]